MEQSNGCLHQEFTCPRPGQSVFVNGCVLRSVIFECGKDIVLQRVGKQHRVFHDMLTLCGMPIQPFRFQPICVVRVASESWCWPCVVR